MDADTRVALWEAFSEFFLDTELDEAVYEHVARVVRASGVTRLEAEAVLWNEVFPVLHRNLQSVAGEWAGWSREWLVANIRPSQGVARRTGPTILVEEVQGCWDKVLMHLGANTC